MSHKAETELCRRIINVLKAKGCIAWKNHGSVFSVRGLPDITGFRWDGIGFILEVKLDTDTYGLSKSQSLFLRKAKETIPHLIVGVVTSVDEALELIHRGNLPQDRCNETQ